MEKDLRDRENLKQCRKSRNGEKRKSKGWRQSEDRENLGMDPEMETQTAVVVC